METIRCPICREQVNYFSFSHELHICNNCLKLPKFFMLNKDTLSITEVYVISYTKKYIKRYQFFCEHEEYSNNYTIIVPITGDKFNYYRNMHDAIHGKIVTIFNMIRNEKNSIKEFLIRKEKIINELEKQLEESENELSKFLK